MRNLKHLKNGLKTVVFAILAGSALPMTVSAQLPSATHHYFDLSKGDVILLPDATYGWGWSGSAWVQKSTGTGWGNSSDVIQHIVMDPGNKFDGTDSSLDSYRQAVTETSGGTVDIVDETNVATVLNNWETKATALNRPSSGYRIVVACNVRYTVLLDNVWSTYQQNPDNGRGGITFYPQTDYPNVTTDGSKFLVYLKGDNRFGCVRYCSDWTDLASEFHYLRGKGDASDIKKTITYGGSSHTYYAPENTHFTDAKVIFRSATAAGSDQGTLTVGNIAPGGPTYKNHYDSVIGGTDSKDPSRGIIIEGGTIFAGAEPGDECTAIGGGGNGVGIVTVSGGIVTAVTSSTGAALGGGIGWSSAGGEGTVTISGGTVYAYNQGYVKESKYIPAAAIGGASSSASAGATGTVTITGGTVYAESVGGVAIGGGGSFSTDAGDAVVTISGGTVTAKSLSGTVSSVPVAYGSSIGGGVGINGKGGDCTFTMSNGTLYAGSVGGGSSTNSSVGRATVNITGGDIRAQFIMAASGSNHSSFTMSAGTIHNSSTASTDFKLVQADGGALWQGDTGGTVDITGGTIDNCEARDGGAIYTAGGSVTVSNANITNNTATRNGGAFYLSPSSTISMTSGSIEGNSAVNGGGIYLANGAKLTYNASTTTTGYIRSNTASQLGGGVYLAQGTSSKKTELYFNMGSSTRLGFYDNIAGVGADDIYAYGAGTTRVTIPAVTNMSLGGYSVSGATLEWYEDYKVGDNRYSAGTVQGDASNIRRYRASRDASLPVWKVPASSSIELSTFYEKYLCLTLGFEYGELEIRRSGLLARQSAIYKVEFQGTGLTRPTQYVTVLGTTEDEKTTIGNERWNISYIKYLPKGSYTVTELPWTWYRTDNTTGATVKTQDITTEAGQVFEFSNSTADVKTLPRHDEERKENDLSRVNP